MHLLLTIMCYMCYHVIFMLKNTWTAGANLSSGFGYHFWGAQMWPPWRREGVKEQVNCIDEAFD